MKAKLLALITFCLAASPTLCFAIPSQEELFGIPRVKRSADSPSIQEEYQDFKTETKFSETKTKTPTGGGSGGGGSINGPRKRVYGVRPKCRRCPNAR